MSNNVIRKGLVAAALAGLAATAFAGTPAFAADGVILKANTGTVLAAPVNQTLTLNAALVPTLPAANIAQLKYKVVTDGTFTVKTDLVSGGHAAYTAYSTVAGGTGVGSGNLAAANIKTSQVLTPGTTPTATNVNTLAVSVDAVAGTNANEGYAPTATTSTRTVTVTAWIDSNLDGVVDSGEAQQAQTLTFRKYSEITGTPAITAPITADQSVSATVAYTNINNEQLSGSTIAFTKADGNALAADTASVTGYTISGTQTAIAFVAANDFVATDVVVVTGAGANANATYTVLTASATGFTAAYAGPAVADGTVANLTGTATRTSTQTNAAWDADNSYFKSTVVKLGSLASGTGVSAQAKISGTSVGTMATALVADRTISALTAAPIQSATEAANGNVAVNKAFSLYAKVVDTTTAAAAIAGKTISYSVTAGALPATAAGVTSSTATLTINGVTYTNQAALPGATGVAKLTGVSNADGKVIVSGSSTGLVATNTVVFNFSVENFTVSQTLTQATASAATAYINYSAAFTNEQGLTASASVAAGTTVPLKVSVNDQYGSPVADGKYVAFATVSAGARSGTASTLTSAVVAPVVSGAAALSLPDNGTGTGANTWTVVLRAVNADGTFGARTYPVAISSTAAGTGFDAGSNAVTTFTVNFVAAADLVAGKIALKDGASNALVAATGTTKYTYTAGQTGATDARAALSTGTFGNFDARAVVGTVPTTTGGTAVVVKGAVTSASTATYAGVAVANAAVTVSGKGLQFKTTQGGADVWGKDTLTFNAAVDGTYSVSVYSNVAGANTVTFTSDAATSTVDLYFGAAADTAGTVVAITPATASVVPGSSITVTATVVDAYGNAVPANQGNNTAGGAYFSLKVTDLQGNSSTVYAITADAGSLSKTLTFGTNDTGVVTITATYDADGSTATKAAVVTTKTIKVAAAAAAKTALAVGADQAQVGAAVDVIATATDAAGKAAAGVVVTFDNVGQGYLSATSATTDANGVAKVKLVGNVAGRNTLTATANGAAAANAGVSFGAADANITVKGKRATVTYEFAGLAKVVVSVNGTRQPAVYPADDNEGTYSFNLKAGTNKIVVSIAGKTVDSKTVKIKK